MSDKPVTLKDVHNLVQNLKQERLGLGTREERLEPIIRKICRVQGNCASICADDACTAQTIILQTHQMQRSFLRVADRLERWKLDEEIPTQFDSVESYRLATFRRSEWLGDHSLKLIMDFTADTCRIQNNHRVCVGAVNPLFAQVADLSLRDQILSGTRPFDEGNQIVLLQVFKAAHWCGVVFDFRVWKVTMYALCRSESKTMRLRKACRSCSRVKPPI
ncbi:hypothetical protein GQ600_19841 [Phytophthora cactorum]|nr:hypothetical protein GQ600_19841 [Phytophthora cactorum]